MEHREFLKLAMAIPILFKPTKLIATETNHSLEHKLFNAYWEVIEQYTPDDERVILIDGEHEKLYLVDRQDEFRIRKSYVISTGINGFGNKSGSKKTPIGIHKITKKYGYGAKERTIFRARENTGEISEINNTQTPKYSTIITSRIMWLKGCEQRNQNTYSRYIYIHGTPEEGLIGKPTSHGCIRLRNKEVIELFNLVDVGTYVNIKEKMA